MDVEAQPCIAGFRIPAALDRFPFFWVLGVGVSLSVCLFERFLHFRVGGRGAPFRSSYAPTPSAGAGLGNGDALAGHITHFLKFWTGFWVVLAYVIPHTPPPQRRGCGLDNQATQLWHRTVVFLCSFLFRPADPPTV